MESLERVEFWKQKFQESLVEQLKLAVESNPSIDVGQVKDEFFLNKLATLMVGCEELGARVRAIEGQLR